MALINGEMVLINSIKTLKNLEVGGTTTLSGTLGVTGASVFSAGTTHSGSSTWNNGISIQLGSGAQSKFRFDTVQTANTVLVGLPASSNNWLFCEAADMGFNFAHAQATDPTLIGHSNRQSAVEYWSKTHDASNVVNSTAFGGHTFTTAAQKARGTMTVAGIPVADETFVLDAQTITFKADGSGNVDWCTIAGSAAAQVTNIVATLAECTNNADFTAWDGAGDTVVYEWGTAGVAGNAIVFTEAATNITVDGAGTLGTTHAGIAAATLLDVDEGGITTSLGAIRASTSVWYHHHEISAFSAAVGGSGATFVPGDGSTLGGYQLNADTEYLYTDSDVHSNWDAASDIFVDVTFDIRAADPGGGGNTVDLKLLCYIKGTGDVVTKTQTIENAVDIDSAAQWTQYTERFIIDYDAGGGNQVDAGDKISIRLNLETDTSEVDDVTINKFDFLYKTAKVAEEV